MKVLSRLVSLVVVTGIAGSSCQCGEPPCEPASCQDPDGGSTDAGSTDGGRTGDGGEPADAGGPRKTGSIELTNLVIGGNNFSYASIGFAVEGESRCTSARIGACTVNHCLPGDGGTGGRTPVSAGVVTIAGADPFLPDGGAEDFLPNAANEYGGSIPRQHPFLGGAVLVASASGAAVPAFAGLTVVAPQVLSIMTPVCPNKVCPPVSLSQPMTLTWTGSASSQMVVTVQTERPTGVARWVTCAFATSPGTIPLEAMKMLEKTVLGTKGTLFVESSSSTKLTAGEYEITFTARESPDSAAFTLTD
jgi:hypothetical protein